jgi:Zn-dependent peptidase ImmA (M78 family)
MKQPYKPSTIEQWVSDKFIEVGILQPHDLKLKLIANSFGIDYSLWDGITYSYRDKHDGKLYIIDNKNHDEINRRIRFFHELDHVLRHSGDQLDIPDSFRQMQEWDAKLFTMYASIPYHMIDFEKGYTTKEMMDMFKVPEKLALKRIEDIRQKTYWEQKRHQSLNLPDYRPFSIKNCSNETKRIMAQLTKQTGVDFT